MDPEGKAPARYSPLHSVRRRFHVPRTSDSLLPLFPYILPIDACIEATPIRVLSWHEFSLLEMNPRSRLTRQVKERLGFVDASSHTLATCMIKIEH